TQSVGHFCIYPASYAGRVTSSRGGWNGGWEGLAVLGGTGNYLHQESNLVLDLRRVACGPAHSEDEKDWRCRGTAMPLSLTDGLATLCGRTRRHQPVEQAPRSCQSAPQPGIEPSPRPSQGRVISVSPPGHEGPCFAL